MVKKEKNKKNEILENDLQDLKQEINEIEENNINEIEEKDINNKNKEIENTENQEIKRLKELLARIQADYQNFKMRTQRDKEEMIFFLKSDIFKKILPFIDDLDRMIKNTSDELKNSPLFEGIIALEKKLKKDLDLLGVKPFDSIGQEVNPEKHEVITQIPSETPGIIIDEFEKGYMLGDRILRVAKVVVGKIDKEN